MPDSPHRVGVMVDYDWSDDSAIIRELSRFDKHQCVLHLERAMEMDHNVLIRRQDFQTSPWGYNPREVDEVLIFGNSADSLGLADSFRAIGVKTTVFDR